MEDALGRLRRFGLAAGLLLITYVAAGVTVDPNTRISAFGVPFSVSRPNLLPVGLALASLYGAVRFYYYGYMLATSPRRKRRDLIDGLLVGGDEYGKPGSKVWMYWGPQKFTVSPWHSDRAVMEKRAGAFKNAFPKFAGARTSTRIVSDTFTSDDGEPHQSFSAEVVVPRRCRVAAVFEDVDYSAPVWLNALALLLFAWTLVHPN